MAEPKTKRNDASVADLLATIDKEQKRKDCETIAEIMARITREKAEMWGESIVGFGTYKQKYANGKEAEWMLTAFSPRKQSITVYLMAGTNKRPDLLEKLGKCKTSKACLYINKLSDIDLNVFEELLQTSIDHMEPLRTYPK